MAFPLAGTESFGGGVIIAAVSVFHTFIAHMAVGGGLLLPLLLSMARSDDSPALSAFVKRQATLFMYITMTAGAVSGVGIWFAVSIYAPEAASFLVSSFLWAWAAEWVFFFVEIAALLAFVLRYDALSVGDRRSLGNAYAFAAFMSLFVINGIITSMLTPAAGGAEAAFLSRLFNPSFWPSLVFRSAVAFSLAAMFGLLGAARMQPADVREKVIRSFSKWVLGTVAVAVAAGVWYVQALPEAQRLMVMEQSARIGGFILIFLGCAVPMAFGGLLLWKKPQSAVALPLSIIMVTASFAWFGAFEFSREAARKPYVIYGAIYSNGVHVDAVPKRLEEGVLASEPWSLIAAGEGEDMHAVGKEVFRLECSSCHSLSGPLNDILERTQHLRAEGVAAYLHGDGSSSMPPFAGNAYEREALTAYLASYAKQSPGVVENASPPEPGYPEIPPFDEDSSEYVLLAWPTQGMFLAGRAGNLEFSSVNPILRAQLIYRGEFPELTTENVVLRCATADGKVLGSLRASEDDRVFQGSLPMEGLRPEKGAYSLLQLAAWNTESGELLAQTKVVVGVADAFACANCHHVEGDLSGGASTASLSLLAVHDRKHRTGLRSRAAGGETVRCLDCHKEEADIMLLSSAIHVSHAKYLENTGEAACYSCHPEAPYGPAKAARGLHAGRGMYCVSCHGDLSAHSMSLMKAEAARGKEIKGLKAREAEGASAARVRARRPWQQQPDCLGCHTEDYMLPDGFLHAGHELPALGEELYVHRKDDLDAVACAACHGPPHAAYPAVNPHGETMDNMQPLQYQGMARTMGAEKSCRVCHTVDMEGDMHHVNMSDRL